MLQSESSGSDDGKAKLVNEEAAETGALQDERDFVNLVHGGQGDDRVGRDAAIERDLLADVVR